MSSGDILSGLQEHLGDAVLQTAVTDSDVWARVDVTAWRRAAEVCKTVLGCNYFGFVSGLDWLPNPELDGEKAFVADRPVVAPPEIIVDEKVRMAGGTSRFQVLGRLQSTSAHGGITLVADLDDTSPVAPSWVPVYRGADWHERETWEMFGFEFEGHPGLRHIYLPSEFEGYPLRKDFPLLSRMVRPWPGLVDMEDMPPKPADEETQAQP